MGMLGKIIKAAVVMFAVGALLAMAAPPITVALGFSPDVVSAAASIGFNSQPLWLGSFFAAFGAIQAAVAPMFEKVIPGEPKEEKSAEKTIAASNPGLAPCCEPEKTQFRDRENARSANAQAQQQR